jgi:hypothetical protein
MGSEGAYPIIAELIWYIFAVVSKNVYPDSLAS